MTDKRREKELLALEKAAQKLYETKDISLPERIQAWVESNYNPDKVDLHEVIEGITKAATSGEGDRYFTNTASMIINTHEKLSS